MHSFFGIDPYFWTIGERLPRVLLSAAIAMLATFVSLDLANRVHRAADRTSARIWIVAGSLAMGTGIWSMHFIAMSAPVFPFKAGYELLTTAVSWSFSVVVSAGLLSVAERTRPSTLKLWGYATAIGVGFFAMHSIGMRALVVSPVVTYFPVWLAASVLSAVGGSGLALAMFFNLRKKEGSAQLKDQMLAAALFGFSLAAMHYFAMAAIDFADETICLSAYGLDATSLGGSVAFASVGFLLMMLMMTTLERRAERLAKRLNDSLTRAEKDLQYVTFNDPLTGLPNRLVFQDRLKQAVARCSVSKHQLVVLLVELDGFQAMRHTFSDLERDAIMREVSARLVAASAGQDAVAFVGAHQFLILLEDDASMTDAIAVADRIAGCFARPCCTGQKEAKVSASVGVTTYPADGTADKIVSNANTALEAARANGGNCYRFFEFAMDLEAHATSEWLEDLRLAVARGQLELYYQPKIHAQSGLIAGVEALLRWRHPDRGMVSPAVFIPLAEKFGLMNELGSWVISEASRQMGEWRELGLKMRVAINVSVIQLRQPGLAAEITSALDRHHVAPALLTCEITESSAMTDSAATLAVFKTLEAAGIQISIDDFGTGYSSLSYLRKMPVRQLKIDRSFVMDLGRSEDADAVVAAIVQLAHALRLEVVAEGVETELQKSVLLDLGCDKFQGFLFARPMSAEALTSLATQTSETNKTFRESIFTNA